MLLTMDKICLVCGGSIPKKINESRSYYKEKKKYCSRACKDASQRGKPAWNSGKKTGPGPWLGKKRDEETKRKISETRMGRFTNKDHPRWKGDNAGYIPKHSWFNRHYPKVGCCQNCGIERKTAWANLDHLYDRDRPEMWLELCYSCHRLYDRGKLVLSKKFPAT